MKNLPLKLRKNRFNYTQVLRGDRSCIYAQEVEPDLTCYEVSLIKVKPPRKIIINGEVVNTIEEKEQFPPDTAFGYWAWSCRNYEDALQKHNELEALDQY